MRTQREWKSRPVARMWSFGCLAVAALVLATATTAQAGPTGVMGGSQHHSNMQPSLALNYMICMEGLYPTRDGASVIGASHPYLGEVNIFAGYYAPNGWAFCQGQILPISQHNALYSILGTAYGGDGRTTFGLPDLRGRTPVGAGQGSGLTNRMIGTRGGVETVTLTAEQMPTHSHTLPSSSQPTGNAGGSQPHTNMQPYLAMNHTIAATGEYPSRTNSTGADVIGSIDIFAGYYAPAGTELLDGELLPISQNDALFSIIGTTYGGDGRTMVGMPDLRGRAAVHAGSGPGLTTRRIGSELGVEEVTLTEAQMPSHAHEVLPSTAPPVHTSATGGSQPHTNMQPDLVLNYIIALHGAWPGRHDDDPVVGGAEPYLGQIEMFAGSFAPAGWAFCDGQLLPISQHDALFSILGTTYGGDGRTMFGLPDLRGRVAIGAGQGPGLSSYSLGRMVGSETVTLTTSQLPAHSHSTPDIPVVPEPTSTALCLVGLAGLVARRVRNRNHS